MVHKQKPLSSDTADKLASEAREPGWQETTLQILLRFQRFAWDGCGIILLAFSLMTLLAVIGVTQGALLTPWANFLMRWVGYGSVLVIAVLIIAGLYLLRRRSGNMPTIPWGKVLALEIAAFAGLAILSVLQGTSLSRAEAMQDGGRVGWGLAELLGLAIGPFWRMVFLAGVFLTGMVIGLGLTPWIGTRLRRFLEGTPGAAPATEGKGISVAPLREQSPAPSNGVSGGRQKVPRIPSRHRKRFKLPPQEKSPRPPPPRDDRLPPLNLLIEEQSLRPNERNINLTAGLIEKTLAEFGIPAKVVDFRVGPTVTQFAVEPGFIEKPGKEEDPTRHKVRVAQISALSRDLALALSAERLRIEAPVPGRSYVGIEVPNAFSSVVRLRQILESPAFYNIKSPLAIALGLDVSGLPVVDDLGSMPHLLVAGTTGSGKSVCIAAITLCLAINNSPEDLRLVMIDPKKVELVRFNGLPHLYGKVETDLERILGVLRWVVAEMDHRYRLLEQYRSRNIHTFNRKMRRRKNPPERPLPQIVVLIDELADLMMSAPEETESTVVRLAQLSRATGIHLVIATQRPSTDVVTGLIKANFPARLAFAVASSIDSRVILDTTGAESLLGRGDMLFLPPQASAPIRSQGAIVTDREIERVITFWQKQYPPEDRQEAPWVEFLAQEQMLADRDELVEKAIAIVRATQHASASMLQRRLRVGYPRAARLVDELEELGIVGPSQGGGREREVLIGPEDEGDL